MADEEECSFDTGMLDAEGLRDIKGRPDFLEKLRLDVTPRMVMEPRFHSKSEDREKLREISGYMFYIESQCEPPALMLMRVGRTDTIVTVGRVEEIPSELLMRAIDNPVEAPSNGMYAITDDIKEWLKKQLGL